MSHRFQYVIVALASIVLFSGADWLQFLGNDRRGVAPDEDVPSVESSSMSIAWQVPLQGRGLSGPIVIGENVIITSCSGYRQDRLHVLCFAIDSGEKLWERQFWATGRTMCQNKMCVATPTPASDGKRIFAFYSSNDLACLDLDGNLLWFRGLTHDYPNASNSLGMASSPVVIGDTLVVQVESDAEAFATGLQVETGIPRWKIDRTKRANWTTPAILKGNTPGDDLALLQSSAGVAAVRARSGEVVWSYDQGADTISSLAVSDNTIYVPSHGLTALQPIKGKRVPKLLWQENRLSPATASPLVDRGRAYIVNSAGVLNCAQTGTGKVLWRLRLQGPFSSSPVAAGGYLYFFNEMGLGQAVRTGEKGELAAEIDLGETILCTPAIANGALYVRSDHHLWKIATK